MHKDNTPNFQTKLSKLTHFKDFLNKAEEEKDELKKVSRSFTKNDNGAGTDIGNKTKYKYNKVTRKMDDMSKSEVEDDIKALDELGVEDTKHKYKIVSNLHQESVGVDVLDDLKSNFRSWEVDHDTIEHVEELTGLLKERHPEVDESKLRQMAMDWCDFAWQDGAGEPPIDTRSDDRGGWQDGMGKPSWLGERYIKTFESFSGDGEEDLHNMQIQLEPPSQVEFESPAETQSYMFFGNLETIQRNVEELLEMDHNKVNTLLNDGHNWAEDHISTSKEMISHVYNFLMNHTDETNESEEYVESENYMFFANLENIHNQISDLLELDHQDIDDSLLDGHDWAEDHIAAAKENISQVYDFLKSELE
jgi:hypothetical protein